MTARAAARAAQDTLVSDGVAKEAVSVSPRPMTTTSSGTRAPRRSSVLSAPEATASLWQTTASTSGPRWSSRVMASTPPRTPSGSARRTTAPGSTVRPAPLRPRAQVPVHLSAGSAAPRTAARRRPSPRRWSATRAVWSRGGQVIADSPAGPSSASSTTAPSTSPGARRAGSVPRGMSTSASHRPRHEPPSRAASAPASPRVSSRTTWTGPEARMSSAARSAQVGCWSVGTARAMAPRRPERSAAAPGLRR